MNDYWICDEGRYSYKAANDPNLLGAMYVRKNGELEPVAVDEAAKHVDQGLKEICQAGGIVAGVLSPFLTVEEAYLLASYLKELNPANVLALGPVPVERDRPDVPPRPDQGADRRYQLRRSAAVHDSRREMPQPARGFGRSRALRRQGDRLRRACATRGRR